MSGSFRCSRLVEELKLGESSVTKRIRETLGEDGSAACGLPLTFTEDRALTTVQLLFTWYGLQTHGTLPLPERMQSFSPVAAVPYIVVDTLSYCRAYLGRASRRVDNSALRALTDLAGTDFYLGLPPGQPGGQVIRSPILMLKTKRDQGKSYPTQLQIIFSPVLLHGVSDVEPRYVRRPTDLYARVDLALGPGRGKRSPQLPRLAAWVALQKNTVVEVGSEKLARQLRSGDVTDGHAKRFVKTVSGYLEVLKKAEIVRSFAAPSKATDGHWEIVRHPLAARRPSS